MLAAKLRASPTTADHVVALLRATGSLPTDGTESPEEYREVREAALDRLRTSLAPLIEIALRAAIEDDREYLRRIRDFFLQPRDSYTLDDLATLWTIRSTELRDVFHDELNRWEEAHPDAPDAFRITWADAARVTDAFGIVRPIDVERALGDDFSRLCPPSRRTVPVLLYLPRFVADAILTKHATNDRLVAARIEQFIRDCVESECLSGDGADELVSRS